MANVLIPINGNIIPKGLTADASKVLKGKTFIGRNRKVEVGAVNVNAAQTITPGTSDVRILSGNYLGGDVTVAGDSNLTASNIRAGVTIFGVTGTA